jgi:inner membrane protein YidH
MEQPVEKSANDLAQERTDLAVTRTTMAASRSLMAWVRTGLSMIGFGFTIYKFIQGLALEVRPNAGRNVGLFLIAWGTLSILFGCVEYWQSTHEIRAYHHVVIRRFPLVLAAVVGVLGVLMFLGVVLRIS